MGDRFSIIMFLFGLLFEGLLGFFPGFLSKSKKIGMSNRCLSFSTIEKMLHILVVGSLKWA